MKKTIAMIPVQRSKKKPTVYFDTNILSVFHYRGNKLTSLAWQLATRMWWKRERHFFSTFASQSVEDELAEGVYAGQVAALAEVHRLSFLPYTSEVKACAQSYLERHLVPPNKIGDALQLAFPTVYRIDYLLTWNHAHLANLETQARLQEYNARKGWWVPLLVSPDTIPKATLGQNIRRRK